MKIKEIKDEFSLCNLQIQGLRNQIIEMNKIINSNNENIFHLKEELYNKDKIVNDLDEKTNEDYKIIEGLTSALIDSKIKLEELLPTGMIG